MSELAKPLLHNAHFAAFGAIVNACARHEYIFLGAVSKLLNLKTHQAGILLAELSFQGKLKTFNALLEHIELTDQQRERIAWFIGNMNQHNSLRNHIAHSSWTEGARPESIKPFGINVRSGSAKFLGTEDGEKDYTLKELNEIAMDLQKNRDEFAKFMRSEGIGLVES